MSFKDMLKKSVLEGFSGSNMTTGLIAASLGITVLLALYIFVVYYFSTKRTFYNKSFNISLAVIAVITASIILAMQSNLVISLGMVGALSIIRFRTAVKDPKDLIFLFWSISVGIICGAGMYKIAVLASLIVTAGLFGLELTPLGTASALLVVNTSALETEKAVLEAARRHDRHCQVKSRSVSGENVDFIVELKVREPETLLSDVTGLQGVSGASLVAHDGEVNF